MTFDVQVEIVIEGEQQEGVDTLTVVEGAGKARVEMAKSFGGGESPPDRGYIYTNDSTRNADGLRGIGAHETGHFMGLNDLYYEGEVVPMDRSPSADIMRHGLLTNGAQSGWFVLSKSNGNAVVNNSPVPSP